MKKWKIRIQLWKTQRCEGGKWLMLNMYILKRWVMKIYIIIGTNLMSSSLGITKRYAGNEKTRKMLIFESKG